MFAAEQYAQAQAAAQAVAAAQYYANMTAAAAVAVSAGQQPPPPPGSMASVTAGPHNFNPLVTQAVGHHPPPPPGTTHLAAFAPAPPVLSGLQASYLMQQPPLPPKESSSASASRFVTYLVVSCLYRFLQYYFHRVHIEKKYFKVVELLSFICLCYIVVHRGCSIL